MKTLNYLKDRGRFLIAFVVRRAWRRLYDYPVNWRPYGYSKDDMTQHYWDGI